MTILRDHIGLLRRYNNRRYTLGTAAVDTHTASMLPTQWQHTGIINWQHTGIINWQHTHLILVKICFSLQKYFPPNRFSIFGLNTGFNINRFMVINSRDGDTFINKSS